MNLGTTDKKQLDFDLLDSSSKQLCRNFKSVQEHGCVLNPNLPQQ